MTKNAILEQLLDTRNKESVTFRLSVSLLEDLINKAADLGVSKTALLEAVLKEGLKVLK